jgi:CheY-like chemotaxis protein
VTAAPYLRPILLVEDNPMDIDLTMRAFKKCQMTHPTIVLRDGEEAMQHIDGWDNPETRPIVVLLDLKLPRIDGLDVLARIKGNPDTQSVPVVVLSSSRDDGDVRTAYLRGANSYIVKPVDFDRFLEVATQIQSYWCAVNELVC